MQSISSLGTYNSDYIEILIYISLPLNMERRIVLKLLAVFIGIFTVAMPVLLPNMASKWS